MLRRLLFVLSVAIAIVAVSLTPTVAVHNMSTAESARQQEAIQGAEVVKAYKEFSALNLSERKSAFAALSPEKKSAFWKLHLKLYLSRHPELREDQKSVIGAGINLATPKLFAIASTSQEWKTRVDEPLRRLTLRALEAFPLETGAEIFSVLGEKDGAQEEDVLLVSSSSTKSVRVAPVKLARSASPQVNCSCSYESNWCFARSCRNNGCEITTAGCGTLWLYSCNGVCTLYAL